MRHPVLAALALMKATSTPSTAEDLPQKAAADTTASQVEVAEKEVTGPTLRSLLP